ncbi:AfsR/SARP family transcriptional regulator [Actinokineospora diospyrosa]|uniref:DNA-binding transcriptional activator of the SARP family n=1 Tax=Actinokineospora diospyrosa TaxID=103728 RepID=A0ABT1I5T7_9PSEU|nr:tetratricopeptide repeat protein [Actinokineospora diospyrosa]MCP2267989.1 DNA-binding transcriptional activator of the SARP family [Actinokineospora diospyrosa]
MDFRMFGPFEAWHEGRPVHLGDQQQRFFLVVLLLHANRPLSPERLTEIIWPSLPERVNLVRGYISKLRTAFRDADDVDIEKTPTGYALRVADDQVDTTRFYRLREAARGTTDRAEAIGFLREAVALRRGRFLEDIDIDRVGGPDVVFSEDAFHDAVGDLAQLELDAGDHRSARDRLRDAVRMDPVRERYAALLMRALLADDDHLAAWRVFTETEAALAEIDQLPGPVLRNLAALTEQGEPVSSLPPRSRSFTGREYELAAIEAAAAADRGVFWLSGAPGVGKSGLAIEAAHRMRNRFPQGQLLVRLNGHTPNVRTTTTEDALAQLLVEMGMPAERVPATAGRKYSLYQSMLHNTKRLVVLDNAESAEHVQPLLPQAPGCFAIVTSRRMGGVDAGEHIRLAPLPAGAAVELFRALVGSQRLPGDPDELAAVVRRCGHLPMSILVVAALFRRHISWPLHHLLDLLEESGPWSNDGDDLAAALRMSYQLLDPARQRMFRLFGHLPGPELDVKGAAALAGCDVATARTALDYLHEVCLIEEVTTERYQMLDPLKEFAAAEHSPVTPTEAEAALLRLLDFYLVSLTSAVSAAYPFDRHLQPTAHRDCAAALTFTDPRDALRWVEDEQGNLVAAIGHAADNGKSGHAWRMAVLMWRYFHTTSQIEDWISTMGRAKEIVFGEPDYYGQAHVLLRMATAYNRLGRLTEARALAEQALPRWRRLGDAPGEAATLCALAIPVAELGEHNLAVEYFTSALTKYEQCADLRGQGHALSMLGHFSQLRGELDLALRQNEAAVPLLHAVNHAQGLAHALNNLGSVQLQLGLAEEALDNHVEAYESALEAGDTCTQAYALNYIGNVHRVQGRFAEAVHHQVRARAVAERTIDADLHAQLRCDRGETALAMGEIAEAHAAYEAALDLVGGDGDRIHQARAHYGLARVLHAAGKHEEASAQWTMAEAGFAALGQPEAAVVRAQRDTLDCPCHRPSGSR